MSLSTASTSRPSTRDGGRSMPERVAKPRRVHVLMSLRRGRPRHQLLRRSASVLRRQRGEGDGERQAGLSGGQPRAGAAAAARGRAAGLLARLDDELARDGARGQPPHADHRRGGGARADGRPRLPARAVLPAAEFRDPGAPRRTAPRWPWRGWRSPAPRSIATRGLLSTIVLEMGGSSDLCASLQPGEPVILMGPTGHATETPAGETVLLIGGGLGNAVLFSIGQALRGNGGRVIYFAGYKRTIDRYKVEEIERAADVVVWCCDEAPGFAATPRAGQGLRRQHRRGDRRLRRRAARASTDPARRRSTASSPSAPTA